jgi:hypothetical protein
MTKFLLAGAAMLAVSTAALADEPQKLSDDQMGVVAGGVDLNNNNGIPALPAFLLFVTTTDQNTQTNWATSDQIGAAVGLGGLAGVFQHSVINQQNVN